MNINYRMLHCFKKHMHLQQVEDIAQMPKPGNKNDSGEYTSITK